MLPVTGRRWKEGVPRAHECLGPIIWNIFQNDLALNVNKANLTMYADDHQIYTAGRDLGNVKGTIQSLLFYEIEYLDSYQRHVPAL